VSRSVTPALYKGGVLTIDVFLTVIDQHGVETEWFAEARNTPPNAGWAVARGVSVQVLEKGEVKNLGGADLPDVGFPDSSTLAARCHDLSKNSSPLPP
jgi:hypothetical protein